MDPEAASNQIGGNMQTTSVSVKRLLIGIILTSVFFVLSANAAEVNRIGVVDFQRILETSEAGKAAQAEIKSEGEKMQTALKDKGAEIEELQKRLEREALVMDKAMRDEKEREYRIKVNDFKSLETKYRDDFKVLNQRLVGRLQQEVFRLVESIGKTEGYTLILEKREAGVLYAPNAVEITDQVIPLISATATK